MDDRLVPVDPDEYVSGWVHTRTGRFHREADCFAVKWAKDGELSAPMFLRVSDLDELIDRSCSWCWPKEPEP